MTHGLRRWHDSGQSHFVTFSCYRRAKNFSDASTYELFVRMLEAMRSRFGMYVYAYVVMPEHVHLLVSEPKQGKLADAMQWLKLSFTKRAQGLRLATGRGQFWQRRYYDRNVRDADEFTEKLWYIHRNPVKRGLVQHEAEWKWSSYRHYMLGEVGLVEVESEWTARERERLKSGGPERVFLVPAELREYE